MNPSEAIFDAIVVQLSERVELSRYRIRSALAAGLSPSEVQALWRHGDEQPTWEAECVA